MIQLLLVGWWILASGFRLTLGEQALFRNRIMQASEDGMRTYRDRGDLMFGNLRSVVTAKWFGIRVSDVCLMLIMVSARQGNSIW